MIESLYLEGPESEGRMDWAPKERRRPEAFRAAVGVGGEGELAILLLILWLISAWKMDDANIMQEQRSPHAWRST
jgi:hypothetical protein